MGTSLPFPCEHHFPSLWNILYGWQGSARRGEGMSSVLKPCTACDHTRLNRACYICVCKFVHCFQRSHWYIQENLNFWYIFVPVYHIHLYISYVSVLKEEYRLHSRQHLFHILFFLLWTYILLIFLCNVYPREPQIICAASRQIGPWTCTTSQRSVAPVHPCGSARIFVLCCVDSLCAIDSSCGQWRLWSDCTDWFESSLVSQKVRFLAMRPI